MLVRSMTILLCLGVFLVLGGCDSGPDAKQQQETATSAPEPDAPAGDVETATPEASAEAAAGEGEGEGEGWEGFQERQPTSGSAAPSAAMAEEPAAEETSAEQPAVEEAAFDMAAAEQVFMGACTKCHKLDKTEHHAKEELKEEPWDEVIKEMVEEKGAEISAEDQKTILAYLKAKYPE